MTHEEEDAANKAELLDLLMRAGIGRSDAIMVHDLAVHAAIEAMDTIYRVSTTAPLGLAQPCMLMALRLTAVNIEIFLAEKRTLK